MMNPSQRPAVIGLLTLLATGVPGGAQSPDPEWNRFGFERNRSEAPWSRDRTDWTGERVAQNERYGYHPEQIPRHPDVLPETGEDRYFLDRFGRRFKVFRARPFRSGDERGGDVRGWDNRRSDVPSVPRVEEDPLEVLRRPEPPAEDRGEMPRARRYSGETNRYSYDGDSEELPDLSRYPKPSQGVAEPSWRVEPPTRSQSRTEPDLVPVPPEELPEDNRPNSSGDLRGQGDRMVPGRDEPFPAGQRGSGLDRSGEPAGSRESARREPPFDSRQSDRQMPPENREAPVEEEDPYVDLSYGKPVEGKKGFVVLEEHPNLPEIDVRGIAPGTPVEFPDPRDPDQMIQFRVPEWD